MEEIDFAFEILDQRGTGFDPVTAIIIGDLANLPDSSAMDMSTEDSLNRVSFGISNNRVFECPNKINCVFHSFLCVGAEGPIAESKTAPDKINQRIKGKKQLVAEIAGEGEPTNVLHDGVEFMPVND